MDIRTTNKSLKNFLDTEATPEEIAAKISLCGPTFDRIHKVDDDYVFEIEAITNRIDTASAQGVAREAVAILNQFNIKSKMVKDPYKEDVSFNDSLPKKFSIEFENQSLVKRFVAVLIENVSVTKSPDETIKLLERCGERSINNLVDITNELTILYGMPSHIFDYDKIKKSYLYLRKSKADETITTLDEVKNSLTGNDIVIEDGDKNIIDLCGVMGGEQAVVDNNTKNILLIVPVYNPHNIRKTSLSLQKRTLAAQIYEKQPDPELCLPVLKSAIKLLEERAGGKVASQVFDYYPEKLTPRLIKLDKIWLDKFIGKNIEIERVITILDDLGFGGTIDQDGLISCVVPSFRYHDINIKEDLAEEIARIYGYFRLPSVIPCINLESQEPDEILTNELKTKKYLSAIGFSEIFNNSLISLDLIEKTRLNPTNALKLTNALSKDYEYLRTSLLPSLIQNLKNNTGKVDGKINIFELSNTYIKRSKGKIPDEISTLSLLSTQSYQSLKGSLESLFLQLNVSNCEFNKAAKSPVLFDTNKTAAIVCGQSNLGYIGYIDPVIANSFGINEPVFLAELHFPSVVSVINKNYIYRPISSYPSIIEDITITSSESIGEIINKTKQVSNYISQFNYLSSYGDKHSFRLYLSSLENDLTQEKANDIKNDIASLFSK